jgi:peptidyl-prolyl cis-trans isomerase C
MRDTMKKNKRALYFWLPVLFLFMSLSAGIPAEPSEAGKAPQENLKTIVAKVNGQPIYEYRLDPYVKKRLKSFKRYGSGKDTDDLVKRLRKRALDEVIGQELIIQESRKLDVADMDKKVQKKLDEMKARHHSEEAFKAWLKKRNTSVAALRKSLKQRVRVEEYLKIKGISEPEIPEKEIRAFYDKSPNAFHRDESVDVSHILINAGEDAGPEDVKEAGEKAEKIWKEIRNGKDFAEMAKEYSDCNSASGGGKLGYIKRGFMPKAFEEVAFSLKKDAISEPVKTKFGFHIIQVHAHIPAGNAPYEQVRDFIRKFLQEQTSKKKLNEYMTELKKKAEIEIVHNAL